MMINPAKFGPSANSRRLNYTERYKGQTCTDTELQPPGRQSGQQACADLPLRVGHELNEHLPEAKSALAEAGLF